MLLSSNIHGYCVYQDIWTPVIGEELTCVRELGNMIDKYAVVVLRDNSTVVGHLPRTLSRMCSLFLLCGGVIICGVTGARRHCYCISEGRLDIPCKLIFRKKLNELLKIYKLKRTYSKLEKF